MPTRNVCEVARALATQPELLLLDELMAGLTATEIAEAMGDVQQLRARGITVIMIEHVMQAIMKISDRIIVLDHGRKIAEGTPAEVAQTKRSSKSILGMKPMAMLDVDGLSASYGRVQVLWDVSFDVEEGEIVALVGANGAGKTTLLKTISGVMRGTAGTVTFMGQRIDDLPLNKIVDLGLSHIPESRKLFTDMSIRENLEMGAYPSRSWKTRRKTMEHVFELFPRLKERAGQLARTLSGGEQQMLAMGRGLMSQPKLVMIDEPSNGLAPRVVKEVFEIVRSLRDQGITIFLVEQNVRQTLNVADRACVLENGRVAFKGACKLLMDSEHIRKAYLGL